MNLAMGNPILPFDHNLVLPPHRGNPAAKSTDLSPYLCTTIELCSRFNTSPERRAILGKFLDFRARLTDIGLSTGFQWLDGSFMEDVEQRENRAPNDLDVLTIYWGYDLQTQGAWFRKFPEVGDRNLAKANYSLDHIPVDAGFAPQLTVDSIRYWVQLFTHNRDGVWKGMVRVDLNTPELDIEARKVLQTDK